MVLERYIYLIAQVVLMLVFIFFSFKKNLGFWKDIKYVIPALILSEALCIMFSYRFAEFQVWSFHPQNTVNLFFLNLPLEEWLYYPVLALNGFLLFKISERIKTKINPNYLVAFSLVLLALFALIAILNKKLVYTLVIFMFLTVFFGYVVFRSRLKKYYSRFYTSFLFSLIPFFILNIIAINIPVVTYSRQFISGVFLFAIPVENIAVFFLCFLMNISIYEYLEGKKFY